MMSSNYADSKCWSSAMRIAFPVVTLFFFVFFIGGSYIAPDYKEPLMQKLRPRAHSSHSLRSSSCEGKCRAPGSEFLPRGIVVETTNLQMRPLWGQPKENTSTTKNLFAMPVGIKQKDLVNKTVTKFLASSFSVMLFHYDGVVDKWKDFNWNDKVLHVSARNQTKWWFAKRFLHPDIVADYNYIFLWDEDLGVEHFNPEKYLSIVKREGLQISQPALDPGKSEVHQQLTARVRATFHRRTYKPGSCERNNMAPPCTGYVEMMAPVFATTAWRCTWYMIQNDLIHAWGLDYQLGYCVEGDRTKNIGVVDAEYIIHYGRPTLGGSDEHKSAAENKKPSRQHKHDPRLEVRMQSYKEFAVFKRRWKDAVAEDQCWVDPYKQAPNSTI